MCLESLGAAVKSSSNPCSAILTLVVTEDFFKASSPGALTLPEAAVFQGDAVWWWLLPAAHPVFAEDDGRAARPGS